MTEINNAVFVSLIKGLKYNSKTSEYTYKQKQYRLREIKVSEGKAQTEYYYFVNIEEPLDLRFVKAIKGIPTYDGFNEIKIDTQLRKLVYQKEYYKQVTIEKRAKANEKIKAEKEKAKAKLKEEKQKAKEKAKANKLAKIKPKICEYCGKEFLPKAKIQKFCSHDCQLKYNSKKQAQKQKEDKKTEKVCPICSKSFIGTGKNTYCSNECYKISQKESRRKRYEREKEQGYYVKGGKYYYGRTKTAKTINEPIEKSGYGRKIDW